MVRIFFLLFFQLFFFLNIRGEDIDSDADEVVWRFDFSAADAQKKFSTDWSVKTKFMTKAATFEIKTDGDESFLRMNSNNATASVVCNLKGFNPADAPRLRWCWRVIKLPDGADGRIEAKDDQAIGIYIGSGGVLSKVSVSYRWDTETIIPSEGNCAYGGGTIKVKWFTLRNKENKLGEWIVEERNWLEDYKKAWGDTPKDIYMSISCNSQYTKTTATAELKWVEFLKK